jgi:hypothetical protein
MGLDLDELQQQELEQQRHPTAVQLLHHHMAAAHRRAKLRTYRWAGSKPGAALPAAMCSRPAACPTATMGLIDVDMTEAYNSSIVWQSQLENVD